MEMLQSCSKPSRCALYKGCTFGHVLKFDQATGTRLNIPVYFIFISHIHYSDVIMSAMGSQIAGVWIAYSTVCSSTVQRKHQSSTSLVFVRGIPAQKASNTEKCFHFMMSSCFIWMPYFQMSCSD